ncbi:hypothetical protein [Rossellomorea aquimaris]|uniref:Uncharacterized protein n=1 Tax=Rossellomorea aquimaris TaxID=189382 RepID=A0A5D4THS3_9BACI|nr:hypothetical protein [Rossellomorea aquimaris]TYS74002.1 hypothetical protein FZC80_19310 [Rossellomorea aquimaris]
MVSVIECFLSDENGTAFSTSMINCSEVQSRDSRPTQLVTLPDGEQVILQKATISLDGYVTVILDNGIRTTAPFSIIRQFLLCAPDSTYISCRITDFECFASPLFSGGTFTGLQIEITLCLSVQSNHDVVTEITSDFCTPRQTLASSRRCFLPEQSPAAFSNAYQPANRVESETFCIRVPQVYDWVVTQVTVPPVIIPTSCIYEVFSVMGECSGIDVGDQICEPCEDACEEILTCTSGDCSLVLTRQFTDCAPCPTGAVILPSDFVCTAPEGRVYNVNKDLFYDDIQPAIVDADPGNTLIVFPGLFEEIANITVDKSLTITGLSAETTIVEFLNNPGVVLSNFIIAADDVTISNLHLIGPTLTGDTSLLRINNAPGNTLYDNITIDSVILEGGRRSAIIKASNLTIANTSFIHNGSSHAIELRSGSGLFDISNNTFNGGPSSRNAIIFQVNTPFDTFTNATYNIENNNVTRFAQLVLFALAASTNISINVSNNVMDHVDRPGPTIPFLPPTLPSDFSTITPILIQGNDITNPNQPVNNMDPQQAISNLSVYVDYAYTTPIGAVPADGQIQVYNNIFRVALPWGLNTDEHFLNDPVGFNDVANTPPAMSLDAFDLAGNTSIPL